MDYFSFFELVSTNESLQRGEINYISDRKLICRIERILGEISEIYVTCNF